MNRWDMDLKLPTVDIKTDVTTPKQNAQIQTVHTNYDPSVMATASLAGIVKVLDDFKVRHDASVANDARLELSELTANELTNFQVNNLNPKDEDLGIAVSTLREKQDKVINKYGISDLDWRVRSRFYDDLNADNSRFKSNVASDMIKKDFDVKAKLYNTQNAMAINNAQIYYNDPDAVAKYTKIAQEAVDAKATLYDMTDEERDLERLKSYSKIQLTVAMTAAKMGDHGIVTNIANTQHPNMIDDDWRKVKALELSHKADMAVKASKIDPVLAMDLAVEERMKAYTPEYIESEAKLQGTTPEVVRARLMSREYDQQLAINQQQLLESDVNFKPVADVKQWLIAFKDRPSVQQAVTLEDKIEAVIGEFYGVNITNNPNPDYHDKAVNDVVTKYTHVLKHPKYKEILEPYAFGSTSVRNDAYQRQLLKDFRGNIDAYANMTKSQAVAKLQGELGANPETLNTAMVELDAHKSKRMYDEDKREVYRYINTYLTIRDKSEYNVDKGKYNLLIPNELKPALESLGESKVNREADSIFKNALVDALMQQLGSKDLVAVKHALQQSSDLLYDSEGNLKPYVVECINFTHERLSLKYGIALKKNSSAAPLLKPNDMTYAQRAFLGVSVMY